MSWLVSVISGSSRAAADEALVQRFLHEAPEKWQAQEEHLLGLECRYHFTIEWSDGGKRSARGRSVLGRSRSQATDELHLTEEDYANLRLYGSNHRYRFELRMANPDSEWAIADLQTGNTDASADGTSLAHLRARHVGSEIRRVRNVDLLNLILADGFAVKEAQQVTREGRRLVQIEFTYQPAVPDQAEVVGGLYSSGLIICDPDAHWAVTEAKVHVDDPSNKIAAVECRRQISTDVDGLPLVTQISDTGIDPNGKWAYRFNGQYEWNAFDGDDDTFTLSAYGFAEPDYSRPSQARLWIFMGGVLIFLICVLAFSGRRTRQRAR